MSESGCRHFQLENGIAVALQDSSGMIVKIPIMSNRE